MKSCKDCGGVLEALYPSVEDYMDYKFLIKIPLTNWKFMLLKEPAAEYGCLSCLEEDRRSRERDDFNEGASYVAQQAYQEGLRDGRRNV